ncbi:MAG: pectin acetylesterase [Sandaracinaceae bacterium]|nr:pectin acetylesterase [Sandaracinaceae bacterium]
MRIQGYSSLVVVAVMAMSCTNVGETSAPQLRSPVRTSYNTWVKYEPEGAVCSDGSQYKFFANFSRTSDNLLVSFEPGGACWDYESCTGGVRGAANPHGIPDTHMDVWRIHTPLFLRNSPDNPMPDWNQVFIPYCTGDIHSGNNVAVYDDPSGENPPLTYRHNGHANVQAVIDWIHENFPTIPRMFVTGCSAGGVGAEVNYYFLRTSLPQVEQGYLLDDSGPIFPDGGNSDLLHAKIRTSWNVDPILDLLPAGFDHEDFGSINTFIADLFPEDRMGITFFRRDYNFSLYSYERFYDHPPKEEIHRLFWEDTQSLTAQYDSRENLSYYIPYYREYNDSHCVTILGFGGTEIEESRVDAADYIRNLLDNNVPQQSYVESEQPTEDLPR